MFLFELSTRDDEKIRKSSFLDSTDISHNTNVRYKLTTYILSLCSLQVVLRRPLLTMMMMLQLVLLLFILMQNMRTKCKCNRCDDTMTKMFAPWRRIFAKFCFLILVYE